MKKYLQNGIRGEMGRCDHKNWDVSTTEMKTYEDLKH